MLTWGELSSRTDFHDSKWIMTDHHLESMLFPPLQESTKVRVEEEVPI